MAIRVAVTGSSGMVGSALVKELRQWGYDVLHLVRTEEEILADDAILWDYLNGKIDKEGLEGCDIVIHLAGDNVASGRWNERKKAEIRNSRVYGTQFLCRALAVLKRPPKVFICASAIGYYGDRGEEMLDEGSPPGEGFLPSVCQEWEAATVSLSSIGVRVVNLRIGMILSRNGGALRRMLLPFKMGIGGIIGSGQQYISWITLDDLVAVVHHAMSDDALQGPVNAVAPEPITNSCFTRALGEALHRPTFIPVPAFAARLAFGEMADELLLASTRVFPKKLLETGYPFQAKEIVSAFQQVL